MKEKFLAKIGDLEVWGDSDTLVIKGLKHMEHVYISRSEFFLFEKLIRKVVRGFLNGN